MSGAPRDPWFHLAQRTPARIGQGRAGVSLPTREVLSFALAHAQARDAVHARLSIDALANEIAALGLPTIAVESRAADRGVYLRRPDYGRQLTEAS
jgi:ethanolamine ammonia-lyase small subunit